MSVETAVIPVAGAGTRVFPMTTAIEKCLMPVYFGDTARPVIDFMVEDCALGGIERIIFVTSERGQGQLQDYFGQLNTNLEAQLRRLDKTDKIAEELARRRSRSLTYEYVVQPPDQYGTAYPPFLAQDHLRGESRFALMGGDDFVYHADGTSEMAEAIKLWKSSDSDHVIMGNPVAREEGSKYGILHIGLDGQLQEFDEKPPLERIPANPVANISRYLLSDAIWPHIEAEIQRERSGKDEHFVTYAINDALADGQSFQVHPVTGKYLDGGSFAGLQEAGAWIAAHPPIKHGPDQEDALKQDGGLRAVIQEARDSGDNRSRVDIISEWQRSQQNPNTNTQ